MTNERPSRTRRLMLGAAALPLLPAFGSAGAQTAASFPNKPIRIIVPYTAGGTNDLFARAFAQKFTELWGQPAIVDNRPGGNGWIGITAVAKSPPDGHTLGVTISPIIYAKSLYAKLPFDIDKDFEPVSMLSRSAIGLAVPAASPARTLAEFVDMARKNPRKHNYGSFGQGSSAHIYGEALNLQAKIDLVHAAYRGGAPLVQDLVGGQLSSGWLDTATLKPLAQTGKVRILALTGKQRVAALPDVPTFGELGYSGFEAVGFFLSLAPAGTPKDITRKLSEAIASVIRSEDMLNRLRDLGQEPVASTPDELAAAMRSDAEVFDRAIKAAGIKIDP